MKLAASKPPVSLSSPAPFAWFTQIGAWHLEKDTVSGKSFLYHNARVDGARSGQATASVRLNHPFQEMRSFKARMALGPAPSMAGLLVKNKRISYLFLIQNNRKVDSLFVLSRKKEESSCILSARFNHLDTTDLSISVQKDSLRISASGTTVCMAKPAAFPKLETVGFECLSGIVRVFGATIEAKDTTYNENFSKATLINLHLEKMFSGTKESRKAP